MDQERIYLDYAATSPMYPEVLEEMLPYLTSAFGNPSSVYGLGRDSKNAIELARDKVAFELGADISELFFTSGGTESDNWAIIGAARQNSKKGKHIITSSVEHQAVLYTCEQLELEGFDVTYLPVDQYGLIDIVQLEQSIREDTILISIMFANNEVGTIQPIEEIGRIARERGILFHTDAVQAAGTLQIDVHHLNIDLLSLSGHKFGGPKGVGALYIRKGVKISKHMNGGHQERNKRPGTENVAGIVGLAKALEITSGRRQAAEAHLTKLRNRGIESILTSIPGSILNGHPTRRLPGNINISFPFVEAESIIILMDRKGLAVSSGSACTSGSFEPSHVLLAMGTPHELAHGAIRITLGASTTQQQLDLAVKTLTDIVSQLTAKSPLHQQMIKNL
jgi:cysteine desulfurase